MPFQYSSLEMHWNTLNEMLLTLFIVRKHDIISSLYSRFTSSKKVSTSNCNMFEQDKIMPKHWLPHTISSFNTYA